MLNFPIFPEQASTFAKRVDLIYYVLSIGSIFITLGISLAIIILAVKFRQSKPHELRHSEALEHPMLEITWTVVPTFVFLGIFAWGAVLFADYVKVPEGALRIDVIGKQWMWKIQHSNGKREVNELHVPVGRPVELVMTSQDVLHAFYIPEFRLKNDVIPGRYTKLWFEATKPGEYKLFCAEYCGTEHAYMGGRVFAMSPQDYSIWLKGGPRVSPVESGAALFEQRGCITCHSGESGSRGPDLGNVFGSMVTLTTGESVLADEQYLYTSIMESNKQIVEGYTPLMPSFANQLTAEEVNDLIAYIKSLSTVETIESTTQETAVIPPDA
jgi:cytochrome c oxidase subunit 2